MTPAAAVMDAYGVMIRMPPVDGLYRSFVINELHNGFIISIDDCSVFGSIIYGHRCILKPDGSEWYMADRRSSKKINFEWLIWESARSMLERGERLDMADRERLALAVQRLEEWL